MDRVLAPDLLRNFDVEIDPAHQIINLFKPHSCADHVVYWTNDFAKLQIARTDLDQIKIPISIDGVPLKALLDTGVAHTLVDKSRYQSDARVECDDFNVVTGLGYSTALKEYWQETHPKRLRYSISTLRPMSTLDQMLRVGWGPAPGIVPPLGL